MMAEQMVRLLEYVHMKARYRRESDEGSDMAECVQTRRFFARGGLQPNRNMMTFLWFSPACLQRQLALQLLES